MLGLCSTATQVAEGRKFVLVPAMIYLSLSPRLDFLFVALLLW